MTNKYLKQLTNKQFVDLLRAQNACINAIAWCEEHGGTPEELWNDCQHGEWLGWFIRKNLISLGYTEQEWATALSLAVVDTNPQASIILRRYGQGQITYDDVIVQGYAYGIDKELNLAMHEIKPDVNILKKSFPVFEDTR